MAQLSKGKRISGDLRNEVSASFVERYTAGESIRSIAADSGRSYGFVQGLLKDSGVEFRSRGGARIRAVTQAASAEPAAAVKKPKKSKKAKGDQEKPKKAKDAKAKRSGKKSKA